jgi:hypothetical protein
MQSRSFVQDDVVAVALMLVLMPVASVSHRWLNYSTEICGLDERGESRGERVERREQRGERRVYKR